MAMINFDCPECGHNLEVDARGAGFIVKCPECSNPLQIPGLPPSHRWRYWIFPVVTLLVLLALFGTTAWFVRHSRTLRAELADQQQAFSEFQQGAQAAALQQEAAIARLTTAVEEAQIASSAALAEAALDAMEEAESLAREFEEAAKNFLDNSPVARASLLREHMKRVVEAAKNTLPAAPVLTDVGPGRGIRGRQIVFPVLPGPEGQSLRENAEITAIDDDKVSVRFAGGSATYALSELHPGVAAYLPVDPLQVLSQRQWNAEVIRVHQLRTAQRDDRLAQLRRAIESRLPPDRE
ncbi:MAG: hypothetical protein RBT03_10200 [Kiritimatiellia bacterium]|jgi:hypothetical protein|nr:hypothetical protein [Kiritimatiellia bacterium]